MEKAKGLHSGETMAELATLEAMQQMADTDIDFFEKNSVFLIFCKC